MNDTPLTGHQNSGIDINKEDLTKPQIKFLEYCRNFGWGKLEVTIKNGEPVMVSPIRHETKLD